MENRKTSIYHDFVPGDKVMVVENIFNEKPPAGSIGDVWDISNFLVYCHFPLYKFPYMVAGKYPDQWPMLARELQKL